MSTTEALIDYDLPDTPPIPAGAADLRIHLSPRWGLAIASATLVAAALLRRHGRPALAALSSIAAVGAAYSLAVEPRHPILERIDIHLPQLPPALDGVRIGQLSDIHLGTLHSQRNLAWGVAAMRREAPDLLVITGDLVSTRTAVELLPGPLAQLHAPLGAYVIPGNHDYWEGWGEIARRLASVGIQPLVNRSRPLQWRGATFWLAGTDDIWDGTPDLDAALADVPEDAVCVLLAHSPELIYLSSRRHVALQLSGHTHGGHLRFPGLGALVLPHHGKDYEIGLDRRNQTWIYTSRGLAGMPVRLFCPPEATIITLRRG